MRLAVRLLAAISLGVCAGACSSSSAGSTGGGGGGACGATYPTAPADAANPVYVAATCTGARGTPDGSQAHPWATMTDALAHAPASPTLLVAAGSYAESVSITADNTRILGSNDANPQNAAVVVDSSSDTPAFHIMGAHGIVIEGVHVHSAKTAGIQIDGGGASLTGIVIEGVNADSSGKFGHGLVSTDSQIVIEGIVIEGVTAAGAVLTRTSGSLKTGTVKSAPAGGIHIVGTGTASLVLDGNQVSAASRSGIAVYGATNLTLQNNTVSDVVALNGEDFADGIVVTTLTANGTTTPSNVTLASNTVKNSGRAGILFDQLAGGSLTGNTVTANQRAGIWLQGGMTAPASGLMVAMNTVDQNKVVGMMAMQNAVATLMGNKVTNTANVDLIVGGMNTTIGDGVAIVAGASAQLMGTNTITGNGRIGLVLDSPGSTTSITGATVTGNGYGVVLQNQSAMPVMVNAMMNSITGNMQGDLKDYGQATQFVVPKQTFGASAGP